MLGGAHRGEIPDHVWVLEPFKQLDLSLAWCAVRGGGTPLSSVRLGMRGVAGEMPTPTTPLPVAHLERRHSGVVHVAGPKLFDGHKLA